MKLMMSSLDKQEKALMEMFTGTSDREDKVFSFLVTPEENLRDQIAARFSRQLGVLSTDNLAGEPVYVSVKQQRSPAGTDGKKARKRKATAFSTNMPRKGKCHCQLQR